MSNSGIPRLVLPRASVSGGVKNTHSTADAVDSEGPLFDAIIYRNVSKCSSDISTFIQESKSMGIVERKREMVNLLFSHHLIFSKLLHLITWSEWIHETGLVLYGLTVAHNSVVNVIGTADCLSAQSGIVDSLRKPPADIKAAFSLIEPILVSGHSMSDLIQSRKSFSNISQLDLFDKILFDNFRVLLYAQIFTVILSYECDVWIFEMVKFKGSVEIFSSEYFDRRISKLFTKTDLDLFDIYSKVSGILTAINRISLFKTLQDFSTSIPYLTCRIVNDIIEVDCLKNYNIALPLISVSYRDGFYLNDIRYESTSGIIDAIGNFIKVAQLKFIHKQILPRFLCFEAAWDDESTISLANIRVYIRVFPTYLIVNSSVVPWDTFVGVKFVNEVRTLLSAQFTSMLVDSCKAVGLDVCVFRAYSGGSKIFLGLYEFPGCFLLFDSDECAQVSVRFSFTSRLGVERNPFNLGSFHSFISFCNQNEPMDMERVWVGLDMAAIHVLSEDGLVGKIVSEGRIHIVNWPVVFPVFSVFLERSVKFSYVGVVHEVDSVKVIPFAELLSIVL